VPVVRRARGKIVVDRGSVVDPVHPSATCQVRKCPGRAAADHRSHGELVMASTRFVEVLVHHRGFDQIPYRNQRSASARDRSYVRALMQLNRALQPDRPGWWRRRNGSEGECAEMAARAARRAP
jgi:hypothetical protein